jgi:hypothetical protein
MVGGLALSQLLTLHHTGDHLYLIVSSIGCATADASPRQKRKDDQAIAAEEPRAAPIGQICAVRSVALIAGDSPAGSQYLTHGTAISP